MLVFLLSYVQHIVFQIPKITLKKAQIWEKPTDTAIGYVLYRHLIPGSPAS